MTSISSVTAETVTATELLQLAQGDAEHAVIDVREPYVQAHDGHILVSVPLPLGQIELHAVELLPRRDVRIVVIDDDGGECARRAAARLTVLGYTNVALLQGGIAAWRAEGLPVYTGTGVYSKAFGEYVEHQKQTPHISATELWDKLQRKEDVIVLDGRTVEEFNRFSIPGAAPLPNAELPYRIHELLSSEQTLVVINCAGRTRSIIGAQALINAGLSNPVAALEDGTMDWLFQRLPLEQGKARPLPVPGEATREKAREATRHLTAEYGIEWLDADALTSLRAEASSQQADRTVYWIDVRTRAEYEQGHLPGSQWAEGGQLVQGIDRHIGVRNATIVLIDDADGTRAAITASWLQQLRWGKVLAYAAAPDALKETSVSGTATAVPDLPAGKWLDVAGLQGRLARDEVQLLDLAPSTVYASAHIPGARFAVRERLLWGDEGQGIHALDQRPLVLTSQDGRLAAWAAQELAAAGKREVRALRGGTTAWQAVGLPLEHGETQLLHSTDDVPRDSYAWPTEAERFAAFRAYLDWERGLLPQVLSDPLARFAHA